MNVFFQQIDTILALPDRGFLQCAYCVRVEYGYESTHHELQTCLDFTADVCPSINSLTLLSLQLDFTQPVSDSVGRVMTYLTHSAGKEGFLFTLFFWCAGLGGVATFLVING